MSLIDKCRKVGAKLTGTLEVIICLAFKQLYRRLKAKDEEISKISYYTVISLRNNLEEKLNDETMGLCTGGLITSADMSDINELMLNKEVFWPIAKKWSDKLHSRLKNDETRFFPKSKPTTGDDEMKYTFVLSNIGDLGKTSFGYFNVLDVECMSTFEPETKMRLFNTYFVTFDNRTRFKLLAMYNSHFIDDFIVNLFIEIFSDLVLNITQ